MSTEGEDDGRAAPAQRSARADVWDKRREEWLRSLWADGRPVAEIAHELGITRNAVIGKAYRLGLAKRRVVEPRSCSGGSGSRRASEQPTTTNNPRPTWTLPSRAPISLAVPLLELGERMCRFAAGDPQDPGFSFCGHPTVSGHSWCNYHCAIVYEPPEEAQLPERNAA